MATESLIQEFSNQVRLLVNKYASLITVAECIGALEMVQMDLYHITEDKEID